MSSAQVNRSHEAMDLYNSKEERETAENVEGEEEENRQNYTHDVWKCQMLESTISG
jgi:hypothetical protein